MKTLKIEFYCKKCDISSDELIDKEKSNNNWLVCIKKCPKCGGKIELKFNIK